MYNILITDDEQIVIDSLRFIMDKNFLGEVQVFSATSGTGALEIVNKEKIDIVFMDIHMPGMNGLETVSCILRLKPDTVIIMLSAFDKFQYAQEAMNLGAFKYITKPVNRNVVIQTVRAAMNQIDSRTGKLSDDMELHKKLDGISPIIESDFIYSCIFGNEKNTDVSTYMEYFNLQDCNWCFMCLEVPGVNATNQYEIYSRIRELLSSRVRCIVGSFMSNRIVVLLPSGDAHIAGHEDLKRLYTQLAMNVSRSMRVGVSSVSTDTDGMASLYKESLFALEETPLDGGIAFFGDGGTTEESSVKTETLVNSILARLSLGDAAGVRFLTGEYCTALFACKMDMDKIRNALFELLVKAQMAAKKVCPSYSNDAFSNSFASLSKAEDRNQLEDFVQKRLFECVAVTADARGKHENPAVKKALEYIEENLSEDISLDSAAKVAGVSSFYLSKLFKEECGETFVNYISDRRLEKAKSLLSGTDFSVKEISAQVGYNDQNYFSKLFKGKFGLSPTEFRAAGTNGNL